MVRGYTSGVCVYYTLSYTVDAYTPIHHAHSVYSVYACTIDIYSCLYTPISLYTFLIRSYIHPARPHDDHLDGDEAHRLGGHQAQDQSAAAGI